MTVAVAYRRSNPKRVVVLEMEDLCDWMLPGFYATHIKGVGVDCVSYVSKERADSTGDALLCRYRADEAVLRYLDFDIDHGFLSED